MAIDVLQDKIRKLKNPSVVDFAIALEQLPPHLLEVEGSFCKAYARMCRELMDAMKGFVPAVRFSFGSFALQGGEGLETLSQLLKEAAELGFYVLLDSPEILSPWSAERAASTIFGVASDYPCDGLIVSPYIGTDGIKPFLPYCKNEGKDIFLIVRSPNKTASELQDLMTGTRHVYDAVADLCKRHGETILGKSGYSRVAALVSAGSPESLRSLRSKYNRTFLLVDGLDYPSGNAKNCSYAFDRFGHGAVVCAGPSITGAWKIVETDGADYVEQAMQALERMKKNVNRYISIL